MKKIFLFALIASFSLTSFAEGGDDDKKGKKIPSTKLKNLEGQTINTAELKNDGNPIIISFWATWCSPCKRELNTIAEEYDDWIDDTGVKLIAVSVDDERTKASVSPYVDGVGWDYDVLLDPNKEFQNALGVKNVPHTFLIDGEGHIIYSHSGYAPGDEEILKDHLYKLTEK